MSTYFVDYTGADLQVDVNYYGSHQSADFKGLVIVHNGSLEARLSYLGVDVVSHEYKPKEQIWQVYVKPMQNFGAVAGGIPCIRMPITGLKEIQVMDYK